MGEVSGVALGRDRWHSAGKGLKADEFASVFDLLISLEREGGRSTFGMAGHALLSKDWSDVVAERRVLEIWRIFGLGRKDNARKKDSRATPEGKDFCEVSKSHST